MKLLVLTLSFWMSIVISVDSLKNIQVAFLAPYQTHDNSNVSSSIPGLANAVHDIEKYGLLSEHKLNITWYDSQCSGSESLGLASSIISSREVDVIIGPACSKAARSVAELAAFYNIPMLTWHPSNNDDKTEYKTLARFFGHQETFGKTLGTGFNQFHWKRVVLIVDDAQRPLAVTIIEELSKADVTIAKTSFVRESPTRMEIHEVLEDLKSHGRIYIMIVPNQQLRNYMLEAYDLDMAKGDYAFVALEQTITEYKPRSIGLLWKGNDGRDEDAKEAMRSLIYMSNVDFLHPAVDNTTFNKFSDSGVQYASTLKFTNILPEPALEADVYTPFLYDAMVVYALIVNNTVRNGGDIKDGAMIIEQLRLRCYKISKGVNRTIVMNGNADREPVLWILDLSPEGLIEPVAFVEPIIVNGSIDYENHFSPGRVIDWPLGDYPPDTPACGFQQEKCGGHTWLLGVYVALGFGGILILLAVPISIFLHRKRSIEKALSSTLWNVVYEDIDYSFSGNQAGSRVGYSLSMASLPGAFCCIAAPSGRPALYKGSVVSVCHFDRKPVTVTDQIRIQLSKMRELHHSNVNAFLGACLSGPVCALWQFCSKGTLTNVLHNNNMKLDYHFKISLITDIMRGMEYLHASSIGSHGNLTSCNVVVDARWCAKVNNYGLSWLRLETRDFESKVRDDQCSDLFWTAPEHLRRINPPPEGTQEGDVYSFGIIFKQVLTKTDPYQEFEDITDKQILTQVRNPKGLGKFRPQLVNAKEHLIEAQNECTTECTLDLVRSCWHEDPRLRPTFKSLVKTSQQLLKGTPSNLMDNMVQMLEKYANNLEEIVDQRTQELTEEKKKTDKLLYMMLPESVAEALKRGRQVKAESFDQVTIYFSDIVGFTDIASSSTPFEIVDLLNALYTLFDDIITRHDVYKVETIGDAYMLVSGLPKRNGNQHVKEIANCALELVTSVALKFVIPHQPEESLRIRIGLHTGPCVAGVVGLAMPRYCLFGDTVNTASRMESNGEAMKIHMSEATANSLCNMGPGYKITSRGEILIKGKGAMTTYWLE